MAREYTYSILKSSWGVRVTVAADVLLSEGGDDGAMPVGPGLWLADATPGTAISGAEMEMLARGLKAIARDISSKSSGSALIIAVTSIRYNDCDFQLEGLAAAMIGWATEEFGLSPQDIPVTFDRSRNRYVFEFPSSM